MQSNSVKEKGTTTSVHGKLVSKETFVAALHTFLKSGMYVYVYESTHFDLYITPDFQWGQIVGVEKDLRKVTLERPCTNRPLHFGECPDLVVTVPLQPDAEFYFEEKRPVEPALALQKWGKWAQVHPLRRQLLWVETEASMFNHDDLPEGGRRLANRLSSDAIVREYRDGNPTWDMFRFNTAWLRGETATGRVLKDHYGSKLDGKGVPFTVAYRPGRHMTAAFYRAESIPHQRPIRTMDDEIRGVIKAVSRDRITVEATGWDEKVRTIEVDVSPHATLVLDGKPSKPQNALKPGRRIRIFPERTTQRVVILDEYRPAASTNNGSAWLPVAWFSALKSGRERRQSGRH